MGEFFKDKDEVTVYPREDRGYGGLSQDQINEALLMHGEQTREKLFAEFEKDYGIALDYATRKLLRGMIARAVNIGMELASEPHSLIQMYKKAKGLTGDSLVNSYAYKLGMGVSGVLLPNGVFRKCGNMQHSILTADDALEDTFTYIYFSSRMSGPEEDDGDGVVSTPPPLSTLRFPGATLAQLAWMRDHFLYMDRNQKRTVWSRWDIGNKEDKWNEFK